MEFSSQETSEIVGSQTFNFDQVTEFECGETYCSNQNNRADIMKKYLVYMELPKIKIGDYRKSSCVSGNIIRFHFLLRVAQDEENTVLRLQPIKKYKAPVVNFAVIHRPFLDDEEAKGPIPKSPGTRSPLIRYNNDDDAVMASKDANSDDIVEDFRKTQNDNDAQPTLQQAEQGRRQSVSQPTEQGRRQSVSQPTEEGRRQSVSRPADEGRRQSVSQPTDEGRRQSVSRPADEGRRQSVSQPTEQGRRQSVSQPTEQGRRQSVSQPTEEGRRQSVSQPTEEGRRQSVSRPADEGRRQSVSQPTEQGRRQSVSRPADEGRRQSVSQAVEQKRQQPTDEGFEVETPSREPMTSPERLLSDDNLTGRTDASAPKPRRPKKYFVYCEIPKVLIGDYRNSSVICSEIIHSHFLMKIAVDEENGQPRLQPIRRYHRPKVNFAVIHRSLIVDDEAIGPIPRSPNVKSPMIKEDDIDEEGVQISAREDVLHATMGFCYGRLPRSKYELISQWSLVPSAAGDLRPELVLSKAAES